MINERITENLIRDKLDFQGYYKNQNILVEEQKSKQARIDKLLQSASKKGTKGGYPEFIISSNLERDFICIIECKGDVRKHQSKNLNRYAEYAVDGAKLYAEYLSKDWDVLFIGASGQTEKELRISHYLQLKGEKEITPVFSNDILDFDSYLETYKQIRFRVDYDNLFKYVRSLNENLHKKKIPEDKRAILFSGILIALEDDTFLKTYDQYKSAQRLSNYLVESIVQKLKDANLQESRVYEMRQSFSFIRTHTALIDEEYLIELVRAIHDNIRTFIKNNEYQDIISKAYVEFLRYANNDKGLGIVLTPPHITDLFCDLANINENSVVFDNCCGTGGFLVSAMKKMVEMSKGDLNKINDIKKKQLVGIEYQDHIFTLCCSNMILHGDGKTNIMKGDCFSESLLKMVSEKYNPDIGLLNPPYSTGKDELEFVLNNLEALQKNSVCVAIVPMSCALYQKGYGLSLKERLLKKHTLEAVFSMPIDLFKNSNVGTITCIMIFKAHQPHPQEYKTYFGYWKDDGLIYKRSGGRDDYLGKWGQIKKGWLNSYASRDEIPGFSVKKAVSYKDEWCCEAYMDTDYSQLTEEDFRRSLKDYTVYSFTNNLMENVSDSSITKKPVSLNQREWDKFKIKDLFEIFTGGDKPKIEDEDGNIVNSVENLTTNNGVKERIRFKGKKIFSNFISMVSIGEGGCSFYHKKEGAIFTRVKALCPKFPMNAYIGLFLVPILNLEKVRYSYGRVVDSNRLENTSIKLPSTAQGHPDWQFMENYIKSLPYSKNLETIELDEESKLPDNFNQLLKLSAQPFPAKGKTKA